MTTKTKKRDGTIVYIHKKDTCIFTDCPNKAVYRYGNTDDTGIVGQCCLGHLYAVERGYMKLSYCSIFVENIFSKEIDFILKKGEPEHEFKMDISNIG